MCFEHGVQNCIVGDKHAHVLAFIEVLEMENSNVYLEI